MHKHVFFMWVGTAQLAAKVLKAGPADNQTLYIVGLGFMYKDHNASVEISDDGLSLNGAPHGTWQPWMCNPRP